jgi:hypothetical protein
MRDWVGLKDFGESCHVCFKYHLSMDFIVVQHVVGNRQTYLGRDDVN